MTKFDPATHRFGMSYVDRDDNVVYPNSIEEGGEFAVEPVFDKWFMGYKQDLVRNHDDDYLPRSAVEGLLRALENIIKDFGNGTKPKYTVSDIGEYWSPAAAMVHSEYIYQAQQALKTFTDLIGE